MYVRLAFAVAAHLEPEILVVDEVLAVGDAEFQKKCLGKMSEVAQGGRTVLFVSHNMGSISSLCKTAILLQCGRIIAAGPTDHIIDSYHGLSTRALRLTFPARPDIPSITGISVDEAALRRGDFSACIKFVSPFTLRQPVGGFVVSNTTGVPIWGTNGRFHPNNLPDVSSDRGVLICQSPSIPLAPSIYTVSAWLGDWQQDFDEKLNVLSFDFRMDSDISQRPHASVIGHMDWPASWKLNGLDECGG
jgi:lipopolysaccharide transport system ATP-binding protein